MEAWRNEGNLENTWRISIVELHYYYCKSAGAQMMGTCGFFQWQQEMWWDRWWPEKSLRPLSFTHFGKKLLRLWQPDCRTGAQAAKGEGWAGEGRACPGEKAGLLPLPRPQGTQALSSCSAGQEAELPPHSESQSPSSYHQVPQHWKDKWNKERQGRVDNKQFITNMNTDTVMHWRTIF